MIVDNPNTSGIRGRDMQTSVHVGRSVLQGFLNLNEQVALVQADLARAFGLVSYYFRFALLEHINVALIILNGVRFSYKNCRSLDYQRRAQFTNCH